MKIVCLSDTHCGENLLTVPDGDILIHAGDHCAYGNTKESVRFCRWFNAQPHKWKIFIAGNHDYPWQDKPQHAEYRNRGDAIYLQDSFIGIEGLKVYGSPWQPEFCNWAFNLPKGEPLRRVWEKIPTDTDILITHGPPYGVLDWTYSGERVGCEELTIALQRVKPRLHVFGHIHESYGIVERGGTIYVNASSKHDRGFHMNDPIVVEI